MKKLIAWMVLWTIYVGAFAPFAVQGQIIGKAMENKLQNVPPGLQFRLSEGQEGAEKRVKETLPTTDPLTSAQSDGLLKRLPAIKADPDDQAEAFYRHHGFVPFGSATRQLVLPVATFAPDVR